MAANWRFSYRVYFQIMYFLNINNENMLFYISIRFSFCQYPFLLSIEAKMKILKKDSEDQMITTAKVNILYI